MREKSRNLRVAAEIKRVCNELLCYEVNDPGLADVRISAVEVSGDLSVARLYFNTLDPNEDPQIVEAALQRAAGFLRSQIGRAVRLRRVPELRFIKDVATERGMQLTQLIDDVIEHEQQLLDEPRSKDD